MRDAFAFLTVLPVGARPRAPGRAALLAFPVVGLAVGASWAAIAWGGARAWGPLPATALVLLADLLLTGGMHVDAFADVADGIASRRRGDEAIAVMRDPSVGAIGAGALVVALLLRFSFISLLVDGGQWQRIATVPLTGRFAMMWLMARSRCGSERSLASSFTAAASLPVGVAGAATSLGLAYAAAAWLGALSVIAAALVAEASTRFFRRRFDGVVGDAVGGTGLAAELVALGILSVR